MRAGLWISGLSVLGVLIAAVVLWRSTDRARVQREPLAEGVPVRIVAMAPSSVEIMFELGAGDRLVGVSRFSKYPAQVEGLPKVGGKHDPDFEQILSLRPDLLMTRGSSEALKRLCRDNGIRVYEDPADTLPDLYRAIQEIGELLGLGDEAASLTERIRSELEVIRRQVGDQPGARVLLLTMRPPGPVREIYTIGQGSYLADLVEVAGGENIFGDLEVRYAEVSAEEVLVRAPEVIVEVMPGGQAGEEVRALVMEQWRSVGPLPAVQTGRVYLVTEDYALIPSPRITRMARRLAACFHPEVVLDER